MFFRVRLLTSLLIGLSSSVVCVLFLSGAVVYNSAKADIGGDFERPDNPIRWWPKDFGGVITALSITGLVFACHFNILPMHSELRYQTRANKRIILYTAMAITYLLNVVVSFFGYTQVSVLASFHVKFILLLLLILLCDFFQFFWVLFAIVMSQLLPAA